MVTHLMLHFQFLMQKEKGHLHMKPLAHHTWRRWLPLTLCEVKEVQQVTAGSQGRHKGKQQVMTQSCQAQTQGTVQSSLVIARSLSYKKDSGDASLVQGSYLVSLNAPAEGEGGLCEMGEMGSESHAGIYSKSACKVPPKADRELVQGH